MVTLLTTLLAIAVRDANRDSPDVISIANGVIAMNLVNAATSFYRAPDAL